MTTDADRRHRGPWYQFVLVWAFSIAFGVLILWLLNFITRDIGAWPGPDYEAARREVLDPAQVEQREALQEQLRAVEAEIQAKQERQTDLRDSTNSAETTMNRLLDLKRLALEKGVVLTEAEEQSLTESRNLFLANQKQYQALSDEMGDLKSRRRDLNGQLESINRKLGEQEAAVHKLYTERREWHEFRMALIKLGALVPLLIVGAAAWWRWRGGTYSPMVHAYSLAVAIKVGLVMHEHFPARFFKYILIIVALVIVAWLLFRLLRRLARPGVDWLLKQYRESYERLLCPICAYPIRRGPLRHRFWTRRSIKSLSARVDLPTAEADDEPYVCPACATTLYEKCGACGHIRPSLMPACPHCGDKRSGQEVVNAAGASGNLGTAI